MAEMIIGVTDDNKPIKIGIPEPPAHVSAPLYHYRYQAYPKVVYKNVPDANAGTTTTARTVQTVEAWEALGEGWVESPAQFDVAEPEPVAVKRGPGRPKASEA